MTDEEFAAAQKSGWPVARADITRIPFPSDTFDVATSFDVMQCIEGDALKPLDLLFETVSAYGTVGLSVNLTPKLHDASKLFLTLLMYVGRLGPMTIVASLTLPAIRGTVTFPEEKVIVG